MTYKMSRAKVAKMAIDSMNLECFEFAPEEEWDIIELTTIEYCRKINKKLDQFSCKPSKFAIVTRGHTVNYTDNKKPLKIGDTLKCECCLIIRVTDIVEWRRYYDE